MLRWYLIQTYFEHTTQSNANECSINFFCKHLSDEKKKDKVSLYWLDWYEIKWFDKEKTCLYYGPPVLVRPNKTPCEKTHCRFRDTINSEGERELLVDLFDFEPKSPGIAAHQFIEERAYICLS